MVILRTPAWLRWVAYPTGFLLPVLIYVSHTAEEHKASHRQGIGNANWPARVERAGRTWGVRDALEQIAIIVGAARVGEGIGNARDGHSLAQEGAKSLPWRRYRVREATCRSREKGRGRQLRAEDL